MSRCIYGVWMSQRERWCYVSVRSKRRLTPAWEIALQAEQAKERANAVASGSGKEPEPIVSPAEGGAMDVDAVAQ